jgi:hypothetical protein
MLLATIPHDGTADNVEAACCQSIWMEVGELLPVALVAVTE